MGLSRSVTSNSYNAIIKEDSNVTKEEKNNSVKNSRCVSVDTISPTPEGRRKKKCGLSGKQELIKFRCSLMEKRILQEKAKKCDLSLSEFIRRCALEQVTVERLSDDEIELYKMLIKYHNNFKAIGNLMRGRNQGLTLMVYDTAKEIKLHLKKFSK
ncbi:ribbon-helix-helix protein, CopG family [Flavobacterium sp. ASW18X]|nr:ribbon-helix-helix protein, CopG family [Flavobacterium sp. ASW18X]